ncbi:MAG: tetratricopeptide repeat protein [Paracoccaceae bacterium]
MSDPSPIARKTHTVQATAYITERHYEMQIVVADPNGKTIWMNPAFGCDLMAQRIFSFIDTSVADLVDFFFGYNQSVQTGNVWKNTFDVSEAFNGLFSPGTKPIQEIIGIIDRAIDFDPSGFNFALRNCARMLQFGERLDGYDLVTEELVRHDLTKSLELSPNGALTHAIASHAFSLFLQDDNLAVAHAQKSVAMQPKNGLWAAFLSLALLRSGRVDEAAMWTNRAHNVPQEHAGFIGAVACACFTTLGDFNRATYHGERALQLNPNFNATQKYLFACYAHLGEPQRAEQLASKIVQVDQAFGQKGLLSGESALNVKPAITVLSEAARIVGLR